MFQHVFRPLAWTLSLLGLSGLSLTSCPTQPTNPPDPATLTEEYTTCTEVWLRVSVPDTARQAGLRVYRDDSLLVNFPVAPTDTVVIDPGLQPNTTYSYHTVRLRDNDEQSPSEPLNVTTLPTTSHDFTWTIDTLGSSQYGYGSSDLNDVAILDQDNIWTVGDIQMDSGRFNLAKWDGEQWRLSNVGPVGNVLTSIFAFSTNNVWVANLCSPFHWDGTTWTYYRFSSGGVGVNTCAGNVMWGSSSSNMYFVGMNGSIVHYDGATFTRLASGTQTTIQDIWGARNPQTDDWTILCTAAPGFGGSHFEIYQITNSQTVTVVPGVTDRVARSVWFDDPRLIYTSGSGIFRKLSGKGWEEIGGIAVIPATTRRIRGMALNDLFVVSDFGHIAHYNGVDFRVWRPNPAVIYSSCAYRDGVMVAVGFDGRQAFVVRMQR